jgi:nucleoside-diphosphate-sugar epimerase
MATGRRRSFCYVDDLVDGLVRLMATPDETIARSIQKSRGAPSRRSPAVSSPHRVARQIVHRPRPQDDPRQRKPDISKAHETLSWAPTTPLARLAEDDRLFRPAAGRACARRRYRQLTAAGPCHKRRAEA